MDNEKVIQMLTFECRDLLDVVEAAGDRDQIVRDHLAVDLSGYGIPIEEWLDEPTSAEERARLVNEALAHRDAETVTGRNFIEA